MKRIAFVVLTVVFLLSMSSIASAGKFSIGGFAGFNIPISQEDVGNGSVYGVKGRIMVLPFLGVEPNFVFSKYGDKEHKDEAGNKLGTRDGGDITSFGLDAVFGIFSGFSKARFYGIFGLNSNSLKREGISNQTRFGLSLGTGIEFLPMDMFSIEVRARVHNITLKGGGGRDNVELTGGLNYYFGPK